MQQSGRAEGGQDRVQRLGDCLDVLERGYAYVVGPREREVGMKFGGEVGVASGECDALAQLHEIARNRAGVRAQSFEERERDNAALSKRKGHIGR